MHIYGSCVTFTILTPTPTPHWHVHTPASRCVDAAQGDSYMWFSRFPVILFYSLCTYYPTHSLVIVGPCLYSHSLYSRLCLYMDIGKA
ncbi:hypothetical protein FA13DRAFT_991926 [Coprinellus micaceus]|uniref:Uncharacterized protein n=1 Tax=Coprinellus micaceus TaxID=71717 RepID=A0A4Y7RQK8_COPMI|nr:hypothetical protein FA13DRAFT_991926 [Coprinellus micaceus]